MWFIGKDKDPVEAEEVKFEEVKFEEPEANVDPEWKVLEDIRNKLTDPLEKRIAELFVENPTGWTKQKDSITYRSEQDDDERVNYYSAPRGTVYELCLTYTPSSDKDGIQSARLTSPENIEFASENWKSPFFDLVFDFVNKIEYEMKMGIIEGLKTGNQDPKERDRRIINETLKSLMEANIEELPLYMNSKSETVKNLANKILQEGS